MAIGAPVSLGSTIADNGSLFTHTTTAAVPVDGRVIVAVGWSSAVDATPIVSGGGLTWSEDVTEANISGFGSYYLLSVWSAPAPSGLVSGTDITCTLNNATYGINIGASYATGIVDASSVDTTSGQFRTGSMDASWSSTAATTANANDLLIGAAFADDFSVGMTSTPIGGFTELMDFNNTNNCWTLTMTYQIVSATGSYSATGTWSGTPGFADIAALVAYKAASTIPANLFFNFMPGAQ